MAKQSLYLMKNELGLFKIGISVNPEKRRNEIKNSSGFNVELIKAWVTTESAANVERKLHGIFSSKRTHGEWFTDLTIEDIESNIDTPSEWKPLQKISKNALKLKEAPVVIKKPICELVLESQLYKMMEEVPTSYEEIDNLRKRQEQLINVISKVKDKSKAHQYLFTNKDGEIAAMGIGRQNYFTNLLENRVVVGLGPYGSGYIQVVKPKDVKWWSIGTDIHTTTPLPWFITKDAAESVNRIVRDKKIAEAMVHFDTSSKGVFDVFKNKPSHIRTRRKLSEITQEEIDESYAFVV